MMDCDCAGDIAAKRRLQGSSSAQNSGPVERITTRMRLRLEYGGCLIPKVTNARA